MIPFHRSEFVSSEELASLSMFSQCSYIDDIAAWSMFPSNQNNLLLDRISATTTIYADHLTTHLFCVSFKPGKTEIAIDVKGKGLQMTDT